MQFIPDIDFYQLRVVKYVSHKQLQDAAKIEKPPLCVSFQHTDCLYLLHEQGGGSLK